MPVDVASLAVQYGGMDGTVRHTAQEMDITRRQNVAYEYLCYLEEAKMWMSVCLKEELPPTTELEEKLRNGVILAKLGHFFAPEVVSLKKMYDLNQSRYQVVGLHFRHTDNINLWLSALQSCGLPSIFYPETTDVYDKKNMPRVIYCIHALSLFLFKQGKAPQIQDLYGKIKFTDEEIDTMSMELQKYGIKMPQFRKIGGILANEMPVDELSLHAAVIAINKAVDNQIPEETLVTLTNRDSHLQNVDFSLAKQYQETLAQAKAQKIKGTLNRSLDGSYVPDVYDELLTQAEIQGHINSVNVCAALEVVSKAVQQGDQEKVVTALGASSLNIKGVKKEHGSWYTSELRQAAVHLGWNNNVDSPQWRGVLQSAVTKANDTALESSKPVVKIVPHTLFSEDAVYTGMAVDANANQTPVVEEVCKKVVKQNLNVLKEKSELGLHKLNESSEAIQVLSRAFNEDQLGNMGKQRGHWNVPLIFMLVVILTECVQIVSTQD